MATHPLPAPTFRAAIAVQAMLGLGTLAVALGYPLAGRPALAIPLGASAPVDLLAERDAQVLGPSGFRNALMVRPATDGTALAALGRGWLLVALPSTLCGVRRHART